LKHDDLNEKADLDTATLNGNPGNFGETSIAADETARVSATRIERCKVEASIFLGIAIRILCEQPV
jgi:ribosomal protein L16/L10AE